ncbi:PREDICTED: short-chain collagen C4-like [Amphimedon queenslandica]|uniref:Chitin-binding type-4 domain-containing protein n=1 Tax=Amphimedon queenslandica TaxID=400682 RepID=A0A1X7VQU8_AMPQE|nr:PREDICTED: short-chain collagen C4-like [Amphimedon queenslandica]|eukprot:XP_019860149.1 PREDICTED: short-chain collagen C4-like [Amphimedon queenslandica]
MCTKALLLVCVFVITFNNASSTLSVAETAKDTRSITITIPRHVSMEGRGVSFTRWGKACCPSGSNLVYSGYAAGGFFNQKGNGANYLCMPTDPEYLSSAAPRTRSLLYGAEYQPYDSKIFATNVHDYNVPCVVCNAPTKSTALMIPTMVNCPAGWNREYYGYLTAEKYNHQRNVAYECLDFDPDGIPGTSQDTNGALFYFVALRQCNRGLPCGPYQAGKAVSCVICTK